MCSSLSRLLAPRPENATQYSLMYVSDDTLAQSPHDLAELQVPAVDVANAAVDGGGVTLPCTSNCDVKSLTLRRGRWLSSY